MSDGGDSDPHPPPRRRCPICGKPTSERYRPFCSKRCADVDLARWLGGGYAIPGGNQDADEDGDGTPTRDQRGSGAMKMSDIPFGATDWSSVAPTEHKGETGTASWRTRQFGAIRVRMVEYSPHYLADHWCEKGHILLVLDGLLETELADGRRVTLRPGQSYQVADGAEPHRSRTGVEGAKLFIVD